MRKLYVLMLILVMALTMTACNKENTDDVNNTTTNETTDNKNDGDIVDDGVVDNESAKTDEEKPDETEKTDDNKSGLKFIETSLDKNRFRSENAYTQYVELGFENMAFTLVEDVAYTVFLNPSADTQNTDVLVCETDNYLIYEKTLASATTFRFHLKDSETAVNVTYAYGTKRFNEDEKTEMIEAFRNSIIENLNNMQ